MGKGVIHDLINVCQNLPCVLVFANVWTSLNTLKMAAVNCHIGEATNTNIIVFSLFRSVLEPTIYRTPNEHANHYTTNAVLQPIKWTATIQLKNTRL
jgi:hypothetical protein